MIVAMLLAQAAVSTPGPMAAQSTYQRCLIAKARPMVAAGKPATDAVKDAESGCETEFAALRSAIAATPDDPLLGMLRAGPGARFTEARQTARKAATRTLLRTK